VTELVTTRIQASATKLGLPHLAKTLTEFTSRADAGSMGYLDFLDLVLQEELAVRDERRFRAGLRLSKLPHHKTLDDYDFSFQPDLDPRKVRDLATLAFVQAKANVALLGPSESAKPTSRSLSPSPPAEPGSPSTSPPSTTWSAS
jgi:DNA replication protein DnaC